jgi:hypothetical protein
MEGARGKSRAILLKIGICQSINISGVNGHDRSEATRQIAKLRPLPISSLPENQMQLD